MVRLTLATVLACSFGTQKTDPPILVAVASLALVTPNNAGAKNVGAGNGAQFITGGCVNDADCGSACCANNGQGAGVCSAEAAALQNGKEGCGFADPKAAQTIAAAKAQVQKQGF
ncbi:hypothetical protein GQ53DRAFT_768837 [Thozetella sp. PMI_491]|nr:hypothetical protein GQ53DRAFT_768837 [Thozetella sp. PMI_491]